MKATILILSNLISLAIFSQENPWTPKGENPWKTNPNYENVEVLKGDTLANSNLSNTSLNNNDSLTTTIVETNQIFVPVITSTPQLIMKAKLESSESYSSLGDFKIGFTFGMFFNVAGLLPDLIYVAIDSEQEQTILHSIESDSTYKNVKPEVLKNEVQSEIKIKKSKSAIAGTLFGALLQCGIIAVIIKMN